MNVFIKKAGRKGLGVFAVRPHWKGECGVLPILVLDVADIADSKRLQELVFEYNYARGQVALALGWATFLNHSYTPNCRYVVKRAEIVITALRDLRGGEELTINYNGGPTDKTPVGFRVLR